MGAVFLATRARRRGGPISRRPRTSSSILRMKHHPGGRQAEMAGAAAHGGSLLHINRFSTARPTNSVNFPRNQPAIGDHSQRTRTARAILKSPRPDLNELNEIIDDIPASDRRPVK